jgi:DNA-binding NtrC family response regulator
MSAFAPTARVSEKLSRPLREFSRARHVRALVVSPELDVRKPLLRTLEALHVETIVCSSRGHAQEILCNTAVDIVFCDDRLPDGSYSDLVHASHVGNAEPRVVVTTRTGQWDLYFAALDQGAFDVIQCPCYAQDVEMTIRRLLTEDGAQPLSFHAVS